MWPVEIVQVILIKLIAGAPCRRMILCKYTVVSEFGLSLSWDEARDVASRFSLLIGQPS